MTLKRLLICVVLLSTVAISTYGQQQSPTLGVFGREDRYTLNAGDVLDIQYRYTPEFNQTVTIQPDGYISLEIGGDLKVSGKNLTQVRTLILSKAKERLASPELNVILKEFQKPYVVVAGEVAQPGKIEVRERMTAIQAVLMAGGFKDSAKSSQIIVFRKLNADTAEVKTLNFKTLKKTADLENDLTLQPGDMILVPRNRLSKIERYVRLATVASIFNPLF
ncbi:MAG: Soluble ligand binding domain-containing protein [Acidobacteria bacterium]|nr:MAG: Soluble ligand binding domain-containing protein [Acidobacteriota bacterium]